MCCLLCMQVQFLCEKFSSLDIKVDSGLSPSTIDIGCVCVCVCVCLYANMEPGRSHHMSCNNAMGN